MVLIKSIDIRYGIVTAKNSDGVSIIDLAKRGNNHYIVKAIEEKISEPSSKKRKRDSEKYDSDDSEQGAKRPEVIQGKKRTRDESSDDEDKRPSKSVSRRPVEPGTPPPLQTPNSPPPAPRRSAPHR